MNPVYRKGVVQGKVKGLGLILAYIDFKKTK